MININMDLITLKAINKTDDNKMEVDQEAEKTDSSTKLAINIENQSSMEQETSKNDIDSPKLVPNATANTKSLLAKEQIKKRLQSFSLIKQGINALPIKKIIKPTKNVVQYIGEETYDENGEKFSGKVIVKRPPKKGPNHLDIAKAVMNEIEEIKRAEASFQAHPYIMPRVLKSEERTHDKGSSKHKKRSKEKKRRSSEREREKEKKKDKDRERRNSDNFDMKIPEGWDPIKEKNIDFETIRKVKEKTVNIDKHNKSRSRRSEKNKTPTRKEDLPKVPVMFEYPSTLRHSFVAVSAKSEKDTTKYPQEIIKFTEKHPSVCYCENPRHAKGLFLTRKQALVEVPSERLSIMKSFMDNKIRHLEPVTTIMSARTWYPQEKYLKESEIVYDKPEISYGLSVLSESYFDEFEELQESTNTEKITKTDTENDNKHKDCENEIPAFEKNTDIRIETPKNKIADENIKTVDDVMINESKVKTIDEINEFDDQNDQSLTPKVKPNLKKDDVDSDHSVEESFDGTPNTDEYRSNWESDEDIFTEILDDNTNSDIESKKKNKNKKEDNKKSSECVEERKIDKNNKKKEKKDQKESDSEKDRGIKSNSDKNKSVEREDHQRKRRDSLEKEELRSKYRTQDKEIKSKEETKKKRNSFEKEEYTKSKNKDDRQENNRRESFERYKSQEKEQKLKMEEHRIRFEEIANYRYKQNENKTDDYDYTTHKYRSQEKEIRKRFEEEPFQKRNPEIEDFRRSRVDKYEDQRRKNESYEDYKYKSQEREIRIEDKRNAEHYDRNKYRKEERAKYEDNEEWKRSKEERAKYEDNEEWKRTSFDREKDKNKYDKDSRRVEEKHRYNSFEREEKYGKSRNEDYETEKIERRDDRSKYIEERKRFEDSKLFNEDYNRKLEAAHKLRDSFEAEHNKKQALENKYRYEEEQKTRSVSKEKLKYEKEEKERHEEQIIDRKVKKDDKYDHKERKKTDKSVDKYQQVDKNIEKSKNDSEKNFVKSEYKRKCENIIDLGEISSNIQNYETNQEKIKNEKELSDKLDNIIKSKKKINNSWSDEEIISVKSKDTEISKKSKKIYKKSKKDKKIREKIKMKAKKAKKKNKHDKSKNKVKIDYNDYEKSVETSDWEQEEKVNDIKTRHKIKIDYSDFEAPKLEENIKNDNINSEKADFSEGHTPETEPKLDEKLIDSPIRSTTPILSVPILNISPVAPPLINPETLNIETNTGSSKLVSEYEEFMKAVCFDSTEILDNSNDLNDSTSESRELTTVIENDIPFETVVDKDSDSKKENITKTDKIIEINEVETLKNKEKEGSLSEISNNESSDKDLNEKVRYSDDSNSSNSSISNDDSTSSSESDSSDSSENSLPEIINIKQEKLSDSETDSKKRKISISDSEEIPKNIVIKKEKFDMFEAIQNKEMLSKAEKNLFDINLDEIELPQVLPENIPLPNEIITPEKVPDSPIKKSTSFTPIKLVTPELRKVTTVANAFVSSPDDKDVSSLDTTNLSPKIDLNIRKRQSNVLLTISPIKKMLMDSENEEENDFTDKFIKHNDTLTKNDSKKELKIEEKSSAEKVDKNIKIDNADKIHKIEPKPKDVPKEIDKKVKVEEKDKKPDVKKYDERKDSRSKSHDSRSSSRSNRDHRSSETRHSRDQTRKEPPRSLKTPEKRRDIKRLSRDRELHRKSPRNDRSRNREPPSRSRSNRDNRRRSRHRSLSPKRDKKHKSPTPKRNYDDTDFSTTSMDIVQSPINSPLAGFKKSLADSTISDSELSRRNIYEESTESPYRSARIPSPASPKRISLDDRINQVLGIEKEPPKPIGTVCTRGQYDTGHQPSYQEMYGYPKSEFEGYDQYGQQYGYGQAYQRYQERSDGVKVMQVGNVIQVVPTEQPHRPNLVQPVAPKVNVHEMPPKVVQVGNMLQIVPVALPDENKKMPILPSTSAVVSQPIVAPAESNPAAKTTEQLLQERRAEKEKRRQEREQRRQDKERKRKEKEKRRQLKMKIKTESMIKKALLLETEEITENEVAADIENVEIGESRITTLPWPPSNVLTTVSLNKTPSKGILVTHGFSRQNSLTDSELESKEMKKVVKFADGICPGEGTSPSGGEELPSPPPPPRKLPKEKRYQKKLKNKKKIKVKIIRTQQPAVLEEEDESEDDLPPPPPPPGSPPPHLWPPRVKPLNNVHPQMPAALYPPAPFIPSPALYPPAYPPAQNTPRHHMPVLPVQQGGMHMPVGHMHAGPPIPAHLGPPGGGMGGAPHPHPSYHPHRHPD